MFIDDIGTKIIATEALVDVAKHCLHAVYHAPQIDAPIGIKTAIVGGEVLEPIIETLEFLGDDELVPWMDGITYRKALEEDTLPVVLLIGADLSQSHAGWDCGACGFPSCAEFNKYSRANYGMGRASFGPNCMLNILNYGLVCDWACAAAAKYKVENRIHTSIGLVSQLLGYLEGCSVTLGLSLGPVKELWYYNRPAFTERWDREFHETFWFPLLRRLFPVMLQSFTGSPHPPIKSYDKWWERDQQDYVKVFEDPEVNEKSNTLIARLMEFIPTQRARVEELKGKFIVPEEAP